MQWVHHVYVSTGVADAFRAVMTNAAGKIDISLLPIESESWLPTLTFGGNNVGLSYNAGATGGRYTRLGNHVWFTGRLTLSAKGSSTGNAIIGGLPYANGSSQAFSSPVTCLTTGLTLTAAYHCQPLIASAAQTILLYESGGGGITQLTDAHFTNSSSIYVSGHYRLA